MADPFVLNADGTASDPVAFQEALRNDPEKLSEVQKDTELAAVLLGEDVGALQQLLKAAYEVRTCQPPLGAWALWHLSAGQALVGM